jgi:hypothetical protein
LELGVEEDLTAELKPRPSYDDDYYALTQNQAKQLRAQGRLRQNEPLDWKLLAEEVQDLGRSELHTCQSLTDQIIAHLLKLEFSMATEPRSSREEEVAACRIGLRRHLTPTIKRKIMSALGQHYANAMELVTPSFHADEPERLALLPETCPYRFDQIQGSDR